MQDALQRYMDDNKLYSTEGERGVKNMEKVMREVCGYQENWGGVMRNFFVDNPGAVEAVITWIGSQRNSDWRDNLSDLVGPDEGDEVGDRAPPEETVA